MALGPGPAGLKFWTPQGLTADNTADINNLPAGIGDQFNPWGPKRPVQDWVKGSLPQFMPVGTLFAADAGSYLLTGAAAVALVGDNANLPAGNTSWFNPWGSRRGRQDWTLGPIPLVPVVLTAVGGSYTITGSAAALALGHAAASGSYTTTGSAAALALGHVAGAGSYALTGSSAALALGHAAAAGSYTITGNSAALALGHVAGAGSYTLIGSAAALALGHTAGSGSYTSSGSAVTFAFGQVGAAGSYTLTGANAAFVIPGVADNMPAGVVSWFNPWGRKPAIGLRTWINPAGIVPVTYIFRQPLITRIWSRPQRQDWIWSVAYVAAATPGTISADGGSYTITGSSAAFALGLTANSGSYTLTGSSAALNIGYTAGSGSYALTGSAAGLTVSGNFVLSSAAGSYAITGSSAALALGLSANSGTYTVSGTAAVLARGFAAGAGAYAILGTDAQFVQTGTITLTCEAGSYLLTGFDATLRQPVSGIQPYPIGGNYWQRTGKKRGKKSTKRCRWDTINGVLTWVCDRASLEMPAEARRQALDLVFDAAGGDLRPLYDELLLEQATSASAGRRQAATLLLRAIREARQLEVDTKAGAARRIAEAAAAKAEAAAHKAALQEAIAQETARHETALASARERRAAVAAHKAAQAAAAKAAAAQRQAEERARAAEEAAIRAEQARAELQAQAEFLRAEQARLAMIDEEDDDLLLLD